MSADNWTECPWCGADYQLREDYDIGIDGGVFEVDYRAYCSTCQRAYEFKETKVVVSPREQRDRKAQS